MIDITWPVAPPPEVTTLWRYRNDCIIIIIITHVHGQIQDIAAQAVSQSIDGVHADLNTNGQSRLPVDAVHDQAWWWSGLLCRVLCKSQIHCVCHCNTACCYLPLLQWPFCKIFLDSCYIFWLLDVVTLYSNARYSNMLCADGDIFGSRPSDHYFRNVCWFVCLSVCLFVCAEFFSAIFDLISIKLGHMLYVWV